MKSNIDELIENSKSSETLQIEDVKITDKNWLEIANLSHLKYLYLHRIKNSEIPEKLKNLKLLEAIAISGDKITKIPAFILELPKLTSASLNDTKITDFSSLKKLSSLTHLYLSNCNLDKIPDEIFYLKSLKTLRFRRNNITHIPNKIVGLTNLRELDLYDNLLSEIPYEIAQLRNLFFPRLFSNPLSALQFGYIFSSKNNKYDFDKLQNTIPKLFDIKNNLNRNFIFIKNNDNYAFIEFFRDIEEIYRSYKLLRQREFNRNETTGLLIHIFGDQKTQSNFLNIIRHTISKWIETQNIFYTSFNKKKEKQKEDEINCMRFFYYNPYPIKAKIKGREFIIDFEQLLKFKSLEKNTYFDEEYDREIPVFDLLKYIGAENETIKTKWNGTEYITDIEIKNFKIFSQINCEFSKDVNVLIGRNGLGKTSFLQALTLSLLSVSNRDKSNEFEKHISFNNPKSDLTIYWGNEYRKVFVFKNEIKHENYIDIPQKLILAYGVNLNTDKKLSHTEIVEELIKGSLLSYSTKSIFNDYSTDFFDPLIILERLFLEKKGKQNKVIDSIINLIKNTINNYLSLFSEPEKISIQGDFANYYYRDLNNNKLQTENLSEGYKDFILQITDIVIRIVAARRTIFEKKQSTISEKLFNSVKGIVIIDEFDRHLHPNLQRKFLHQLKKDFQNIQFVLSTHNIFSLQSAEGYTALILNIKNNQLKVTKKQITKGLSLESVYNEYFDGNNTIFSYQVEYLLTIFKKHIDKQRKQVLNNQEQKEFKKVADELISCGERTKGIVSREIRQLERLTGKSITI